METEKHLQYIDELLKIYCKYSDTIQQARAEIQLENKIPLPMYHRISCFDKLKTDKYIYKMEDVENHYVASFDGIIFSDLGGYTQRRQNELNKIKDANDYRTRMEETTNRTDESAGRLALWTTNLAIYTKWLAVATALLVLVELVSKIADNYEHFFSASKEKTITQPNIQTPQPQLQQGK